MTAALLGLIIFQTYWLESAYEVREDNFNQKISIALTEICKRVEERETVVEISNEIFSLNTNINAIPGLFRYYNPYSINNDSAANIVSVSKESVLINKMNNLHSNTKITVVSGDSVIFNKVLYKCQPDIYCKPISQNDISKELVNRLNNKTLFVEKIVNKLLSYNDDISRRIDRETLRAIVSTELRNQNVRLAFEFAVKDKNGNIAYSTSRFRNGTDIYKVQLFPNDFLSAPSYLLLHFPKKDRFIVKSLGYIGLSSILLTMIIIFSYTLTLVIILRQKKLSEMKTDFINNMTHELKTPISTISLASQMLKDKTIGENTKNLDNIAYIIDEESKRLGYQVEKVLQMAILERNNFKFKIEKVDVQELMMTVYNSFLIQVEKRAGKLETNLRASARKIEVDEVHFSNVIFNLLENALKYCTKTPEIILSNCDSKGGILFSVKDNGVGIDSVNQKRIFEKFYRVPTGNVHNVKGFGLGLSYVKAVVDAHNGWIKVSSEPGRGSEFFVYVPIKQEKS